MGKRLVGAVFIFCAALLFSSRYIAAAMFMSGALSWDAELFSAGLQYVGTPLLVLSIACALLGICYLIWAEICDKNKR